jgi:hypothetical protein
VYSSNIFDFQKIHFRFRFDKFESSKVANLPLFVHVLATAYYLFFFVLWARWHIIILIYQQEIISTHPGLITP